MKTLQAVICGHLLLSIAAIAHTLSAEEKSAPRDDQLLAQALETNAQLAATNLKLAAQVDALLEQIATLRAETITLKADRDEKLERVVVLTDELHKMQDLRKRLEKRQTDLTAQIVRLNAIAEPVVCPQGLVLAVQKNLAEISIGSDDGLGEGDQLDVYRGEKFIGRVVVRKTFPDRSVVEVMPEFMKDNIEKGDELRLHAKPPTDEPQESSP